MTEKIEADRRRRVDALAAVVVLAIATGVFFAARLEPKALYDPFGPGTAPMAVSVALAGLAIVLLARALLGLRVGQSAQSLILGLGGAVPEDYRLRPDLAVAAFATTVCFAGAISAGAPFLWSTVAFLFVLGTLMTDRRPRSIAMSAVVAVVGSVAIDTLFRRILLLQLP